MLWVWIHKTIIVCRCFALCSNQMNRNYYYERERERERELVEHICCRLRVNAYCSEHYLEEAGAKPMSGLMEVMAPQNFWKKKIDILKYELSQPIKQFSRLIMLLAPSTTEHIYIYIF